MFLGTYEHSIDDKGRMTIPARFREFILGGAYLTQGIDHNLVVMLAENFDRVMIELDQMSGTDPTIRLLKRKLFANAQRVEIDRLGRILIAESHRAYAQLNDKAIVVGSGSNFEIWSPELWQKQNEMLSNENFAAELKKYNLPLL